MTQLGQILNLIISPTSIGRLITTSIILEVASITRTILQVEVELLKEDNEQLVTQYEREKQLRKCSDQKNLELEDHFEGERKDLKMKLESLSSIVKMFELKAKNSQVSQLN